MRPSLDALEALGPESRRLARSLGTSDEATRRALLEETPDPEALWALAQAQEVDSLLGWHLSRLGLLGSAPWSRSRDTVLRARAVARAAHDWRSQCARLALGALGAAGVPAVPIKGLWLAEHHYPEPWCRTMGDVNLVVPAEPSRVLEALGRRDVRPASDDPALLDDALRDGDELTVVAPWRGSVSIDLHFKLYPDLPLTAAAEVLARAEPGRLLGETGLGPSLTDHLLVVAHHLVLGTERPAWRWWLDVDRLVRSSPDWDATLERASAWGCPATLATALAGAAQLFGSPVPERVWGSLWRSLTPSEQEVVARAWSRGAWALDRDALLLSLQRGRSSGWRQLHPWQILWPPAGLVARRTGIPSTRRGFWVHRLRFAASRLGRVARAVLRAASPSSRREP